MARGGLLNTSAPRPAHSEGEVAPHLPEVNFPPEAHPGGMTTFQDLSAGMADAVRTAGQSVVTVMGVRPVTVSGTVIADGQVLTVAHVLHSDEVTVRTPDGRELPGTVAGRDPATDLALVRVDGLNVAPLSPSAGARVGELLLAVGRPTHGVQVSLGLMEREAAPERGPLRGWLNAGAAPFRGVSGGALVDARGGLVGVLNAGMSRGILLAVPASRALKVAETLSAQGRVPRGYLGVATQPVRFPDPAGEGTEPERGSRRGRHGRWGRDGGRVGLAVVQVEEGSPAAQAGMLVGDVLLALDGEGIRHPGELLERVRERAGETLTVRVLRGGQELDLTLTVGTR